MIRFGWTAMMTANMMMHVRRAVMSVCQKAGEE